MTCCSSWGNRLALESSTACSEIKGKNNIGLHLAWSMLGMGQKLQDFTYWPVDQALNELRMIGIIILFN